MLGLHWQLTTGNWQLLQDASVYLITGIIAQRSTRIAAKSNRNAKGSTAGRIACNIPDVRNASLAAYLGAVHELNSGL